MKTLRSLLIFALLCTVALPAFAESLSLDENFHSPRFVAGNPALRSVLLPDGRFLRFYNVDTLVDQPAGPLTRYLADGTLDTSFHFPAGYVNVSAVAAATNGKLIVSAVQNVYSKQVETILRLNEDGSLDPTFSATEVSTVNVSIVAGIVVQPDQRILITGSFESFAGEHRVGIARLLAEGGIDSSFAGVPLSTVSDQNIPAFLPANKPALQPDGKIVIFGSFRWIGNSQFTSGVARLNADGTLDTTFHPSGFTRSSNARAALVQSDGKILIGGRFSASPYSNLPIVRLNPDGSFDSSYGYFSFPPGTPFNIRDMAFQADGKIVATDSTQRASVFRFNTDGTLDFSFSQPVFAVRDTTAYSYPAPYIINVQTDGRLLVSGFFTDIDDGGTVDDSHYGIIRFNSDGSVDSTFTTAHKTGETQVATSFSRLANGSTLVGFQFNGSNLEPTVPDNIARLSADGSLDLSFNPFTEPNAAPLSADYISSAFARLADGGFLTFGIGDSSDLILKYGKFLTNGAQDPTFAPAREVTHIDQVVPLADGKSLVVTSDPQSLLSQPPVLRLNHDGSLDATFTLDGSIYVDQVIRSNYDGTLEAVYAGCRVLAVRSDGKLIFIYFGQDLAFHLVRVGNDGQLDPSFTATTVTAYDSSVSYPVLYDPFNPGGPTTLQPPGGAWSATISIADAVVLSDGRVVTAGAFTNFGNTAARGLVRLSSSGAIDPTFHIGGGAQWTQTTESAVFFPAVEQVEQLTDGTLLIAGTFEAFNGVAAPGFAHLNQNGSVDTSFVAPAIRQKSASGNAILARQPDGSFLLSGPYSRPNETELSLIHINSIGGVPLIGSPSLAVAIAGQPFSFQITASATPGSYSATGLPIGFTLNPSTGVITGSPAQANIGSYTVTVTASNAAGTSSSQELHLVVSPPAPVITSALSVHAAYNQPFTYHITATNSPSRYLVDSLPPYFSFDESTGVISGTPTGDDPIKITFHALNFAGATTAILTIIVDAPPPAPVITSPTKATATHNQPFSYQITATNNPTSFSASNLPAGLAVNAATGLISGTPQSTGSFFVQISATNSGGLGAATLILSVNAGPLPVITSGTTATATQGQTFSYQIVATNSPTNFSAFGLPTGLTIDMTTGLILGVPAVSGEFSVGIGATNADGTGQAVLHLTIAASTSSTSGVANISTRLSVGTDANVLIAGFIITGNAPKKLIIRASGPSLGTGNTPIAGALQDPILNLYNSAQNVIASNDNWRSTQEQEITATGVAPNDDREPALVVTLNPGSYTAIVAGKNESTGVAIVEVYDLGTVNGAAGSTAKLANISTRGLVQQADNVMIGGFIIPTGSAKLLVRTSGPSLGKSGVAGALQDTTLDLVNSNGQVIASNDDWRSTQEQEIIGSQVAPSDNREAALVATLPAGSYTAIVRGKNETTGVGSVEIYVLQ